MFVKITILNNKWVHPTVLDLFGFLNIFHKFLKIHEELGYETKPSDIYY